MNEPNANKNQRDFLRVVKLGAALSLAGMAAFLYSLKQVHPDIRVKFTAGTALVFVLMAVVVWIVLGVLFREAAAGGTPTPGHALSRLKKPVARWLIGCLAFAAAGTMGAFAYAVKDVSGPGLRDVVQGTLMACLALGCVGLLLWRVVRFFEDASQPDDKDENDDP